MAIFLSRRWRRQPPIIYGWSRKSPLADGLCFLAAPGLETRQNLVNGNYPTWDSNSAFDSDSIGRYYKQTAAGQMNYGLPLAIPGGTNEYTIAAYAAPTSSVSVGDMFYCGNSVGPNFEQIELAANSDFNANGSAGKFALVEYSGGFLQCADTSATTYCDGNPHVYAASTQRSIIASLYFDGVIQTVGSSSTNAAAVVDTGTNKTCIGGDITNIRNANFPIYMAAAWLRMLSAAEHAEISSNPWQLFANQPGPIYFLDGVAAGGAANTTGFGQFISVTP